jgi:hypothetical protein
VKRSAGLFCALLGWTASVGAQTTATGRLIDLPVPGGIEAVSRLLEVEPPPPPERLVTELVRRLYDVPGDLDVRERLSALVAGEPRASETVPLPLPLGVWSRILGRDVSPQDLFAGILSDRQAALIAYGLSALDPPTLAFLADRPSLVATLRAQGAGIFAAFGRSLVVHENRVITPGGDEARGLWQVLAGIPIDEPEAFIEALYTRDAGRLAYLYDAVAQLDEARARFALGRWFARDEQAVSRFFTLYQAVGHSFRLEWHPDERPFSRMPADLAVALLQVRVDPTGRVRPPGWLRFWQRVFDGDDLPRNPARTLGDLVGAPLVDAADLLGLLGSSDPTARAERLATLAFGQRVFEQTTAESAPVVLVALRGQRRFPALAASLERMGIRDPAVFAAAAGAADRLTKLGAREAAIALREFQATLVLVGRMRQRRLIDATAAGRLVQSFVAIPPSRSGYNGAIAQWLDVTLGPAVGRPLDREASADDALIELLAGLGAPAEAARPRFVTWEGRLYRVDPVAAEIGRLKRVRARQGGPTLDEALGVSRALARMRAGAVDPDDARRLESVIADAVRTLRAIDADASDIDFGWRTPTLAQQRALLDLERAAGTGDVAALPRLAPSLAGLGDMLLADVLTSFAYATALGNPDSRVLLGVNVAYRHDFGLSQADGAIRRRTAWGFPQPVTDSRLPWHVAGSLFGLDAGLSALALRRVVIDADLHAPVLNSSDRKTFVDTVVLLNAFDMTDADRDAIVSALGAGRRRLTAAAGDEARLDALAEAARLDGWRRQQLRWLRTHDPARMTDVVSLAELVRIGGVADGVDLRAWGVGVQPVNGCLCTWFPAPNDWHSYTGRPGLGLIGAQVADLTLRVAELMKALDLPAALTPAVLSAATLDFVDGVEPAYDDDWPALVAAARALTRERVEDYTAALTIGGPLIPDAGGRDGDRRP